MAGMGATLPSSHVKPSPHTSHAVAPFTLWYLPSGHAAQSWLRLAAAKVPLLHSFASTAPAKQKLPAGQSTHCVLAASPDALLNVPSWHGNAADAPTSQ